MSIRDEIASILKEYDISVRGLSEKSGVRRQSLSRFLAGGNIHIKNLEKLLAAIGYDLNIKSRNDFEAVLKQRLKLNRNEIGRFCKKNSILRLSFFGSVLRGDFNKDSDVDILVEFKKPVSFFELSDIEKGLAKILKTKHKLDVVTKNSLSPLIAEEIKNSTEVVYEEAA